MLVNCVKVSEARSLDRDVVENGLTFAGFAVIIQTLLFMCVLFIYVVILLIFFFWSFQLVHGAMFLSSCS